MLSLEKMMIDDDTSLINVNSHLTHRGINEEVAGRTCILVIVYQVHRLNLSRLYKLNHHPY